MVSQVSGGVSLVRAYGGKIQIHFDFYKAGENLWVADILIGCVSTIYSRKRRSFGLFLLVNYLIDYFNGPFNLVKEKNNISKVKASKSASKA
jgi:hypothetical protein